MMRTALAIAAGCCLLAPLRARCAPVEESAREAALEALAAKADMPAMRPVLPSLLGDRDPVRLRERDRDDKADQAKGTARGPARSEAAKANAAAARSEAAKAARAAKDDARKASEKMREEKTRKKPKPPRPDGGASP